MWQQYRFRFNDGRKVRTDECDIGRKVDRMRDTTTASFPLASTGSKKPEPGG